MDNINVQLTKRELLLIIKSLLKVQVATGIKDEELISLCSNLTIQAMGRIHPEEVNELLRK